MNISEVRTLFPHLAKGITYLNHASSGPFSVRLLDVMHEYLRDRSSDKIDEYPAFVEMTAETKNLVAEYLNTDSTRIAFLDNTTNGINVLARGFPWKKGDEIILNDIEFPANVYPFLNLEKEGVKLVFAKSHDGIVSAEDIIEK